MKHQTIKRLLALLLAALLFVSASPVTVLAEAPRREGKGAVRGTPIEIGGLRADASHPTQDGEGLIYTLSEGSVSETWTNYYAASDDCVTLLKKGQSAPVAIGQLTEYGTSDGILLNRGGNVFCIRNSQWNLNCAGHSDLTPLAEGDVLVVQGQFSTKSGSTTVSITPTYITKNADGTLNFGSSLPQAPIEAGEMKQNPDQPTLTNGSFYFKMDDNAIPFTEGDWENAFYATGEDCIKLIRDGGEPVGIAIPADGRGVIVKYSQNGYYFNGGNAWFIGDSAPLKAGDTVIVSGKFTNGTTTFNITESTVTVGADGTLDFGEEEPPVGIIEAGVMLPSSKERTNKDFYFTMAENAVPADPARSTYYKPVATDVIQRTRDGETYDMGNLMANTLAKDSATEWYMKLNAIGGAIIPGDVIRVSGNFTDGKLTFHISESIITCNADGSLTFSEGGEPSELTVVEAGAMQEHPNGRTDTGIYFQLTANEAPYLTDWTLAYKPETADCIKLVRGGSTASIAKPATETLVKFSETGYYLKTEAYTMGNAVPLQEGDILIIEGNFINEANNTALHFASCYIQIKDGKAVFSTQYPHEEEPPEVIEAGVMLQSEKEKTNSGFYFDMAPNEVPADSTWADRYMPVSADVIQRTRDGATVSVGNTAAGTVLKYNDTGWWMEYWAIGGALIPGDILRVEGNFTNGTRTFRISESYVICNADGSLTVTTELPTPMTVVEAGKMQEHPNGRTDGGIYFQLNANEAPYLTDWTLAYKPETADGIKLVRGEETTSVARPAAETLVKFSETNYYLKTEAYTMGNLMPLQEGDILIIAGNFLNEANNVALHFDASYIRIENGQAVFYTEYPADPPVTEIIEAGKMHRSEKAPESDGFYFLMDENEVPADSTWADRYMPVSAEVITRTRNGETVNVGNTGAGTVLKYSDNGWFMAYWAIGGALQSGDILTVNGNFSGPNGIVFHITESTVEVNADGSLTVNGEGPSVQTRIEAGTLSGSDAGRTETGIYCTMDANDAPYLTDWTLAYKPTDAYCIQLVRGNETLPVARTMAETLVKYDETKYYLKTEVYTMGELMPLQEGDILIVGGDFIHEESNVILNITESYIRIENGQAVFYTEYPSEPPVTEIIEAGVMHRSDKAPATDGFYFTMEPNGVPADDTWTDRYAPVSAEVILRTRNGETTAVGNTGAGTVLKYSAEGWFMAYWAIGGALQSGDILTVDGNFAGANGVVFHISQSVIVVNADGSLTVNGEEPPKATRIEGGTLKGSDAGRTETGIYCTMDANAAPYDEGWSLAYKPVSEDCIRLVRNGETTPIARPAAETLVKYSAAKYYLKTEAYTMGGFVPLQEGDILIVGGDFFNEASNVILSIRTSYIKIKFGQAVFSDEYPEDEPARIIQAGYLKQDSRPRTDTGIYVSMDPNAAPYASDWTMEYKPVEADCIRLVRDGETFAVAIPGRGTLVKFNETGYYLKTDAWGIGEYAPLQVGDILIVEGQFANGDTVMEISRSYIALRTGKTVVSTEYPSEEEEEIIEAGVMRASNAHPGLYTDTANGTCGLYFSLPENAIPLKSSDPWSNRFYPVGASCIKLIRKGVTVDIANVGAGEIVKFRTDEYYLALDRWAHSAVYPITEDDILLVEGNFTDGNTVFHISRSYISFQYGTAFFSEKYPEGGGEFMTVNLQNVQSDFRGKADTGVYLDAAANAAPYSRDWTLAYAPTQADCVKLIRGGKTYTVGMPGRETVVKFSSTEYFVKADSWSVGSYAPLREGDVLVISGDFVNAAGKVVIRIPTTYIGLWYGKAFVSSTYMTGPAVSTVQTGDPMADERELQPFGVYFDLEENNAPKNSDWTLEYSPVSTDCLRLIRDGETYSIATPEHGMIVKFKDTEYYLKLDSWAIGSYAPWQEGDIFILGGQFINVQDASGTILNIPETYIFIQNGEAVIAKSMGEVELPKDGETNLTYEDLPVGETVQWFSGNENRLTVDQNGTVTALTNRGRIRVFATAGKSTRFWTVRMYEQTEFGKVYFSSSEDDLPIAMWAGDYHAFTNKNFEALEEAGITMLVGVREEQVGEGGLWGLLNRAREHNISVIADITGWDGEQEFTYAKHPALKGFIVWDAPTAGDFETVKARKDSFDEKMPDGLGFYVSLNDQLCTYEALFGDTDKEGLDYEKDYLDAFIDTVEPEALMLKVPALRTADEKDAKAPLCVNEAYYACFDAVAQKALENDLPLIYTMHCLGGKDIAEPTEELLRWQFALGLTFGARTVGQTAFAADGTEAMYDPETRKTTDLLETVGEINLEYLSWSDILLSYDWLGISKLDSGEENPLLAALTHSAPIGSLGCLKAAESAQDLLIGSFRNGEGGSAYLITNAGNAKAAKDGEAELTAEDTAVTLTLKDGDYQCVALICKGEITYVAVGADNTVTFDLAADEGIFVIPFEK